MTGESEVFFAKALLIRSFEKELLRRYGLGQFKGTVHTCIGQEACAVGVMAGIDLSKDVVFSAHRAHGHMIAYGCPLDKLAAEVMGKPSGLCSGAGGTQHLHWKNFYTNGIQGGMAPSALGAALAEKLNNSGAIVTIFIGDGTMGQGTVYEAFNISSTLRLPILFVLENNHIAQTTPTNETHASSFCQRAAGFGIDSRSIDGNAPETVAQTVGELAKQIRISNQPAFLELDTTRLGPHSKGDDTRSRQELEEIAKRDPIPRLEKLLPEDQVSQIQESVRTQIESAFEQLN
ncbi:thiamine pyrophosphate-dependent dehydrogenase E1 component subunit alpha [Pelagicoccus mobilis]|uniref:Thiamine pyrophosphate-dependent dehydrogenase E1 component subunit alpha n=1 Tax=Pelagicoccus mobilis TaxID=415221 RepID=A0A934S379_9BACT|nr:thiamine pyrophosphate-dependent dehydrogenase E1 component subunit alpha [Pelagicoccus mobilis]MBK1878223.1 thiamine pyrophosphate-dependent dehydrogenase E1 component subunit alpha [Pelagicoccus mobilis]